MEIAEVAAILERDGALPEATRWPWVHIGAVARGWPAMQTNCRCRMPQPVMEIREPISVRLARPVVTLSEYRIARPGGATERYWAGQCPDCGKFLYATQGDDQ